MARRLTRKRSDAMIGGVAAGFADHFDVDTVWIRLGFVLLTFGSGFGILAYVACWIIMPADGSAPAAAESPADTVAEEVKAAGEQVRAAGERVASEVKEVHESGRGRVIGGAVLIGLGALLLIERFSWAIYWPAWLSLANLWPLILMAIGASMILRAREEEA